MGTKNEQEVKTFLHSVLSCEKGGIPLSKLQGEYTVLIGSPIPYEQFGYSTLSDYIKSIPNTAVIRKAANGVPIVEAVINPSTAHVSQLVANQRAAPKTKPVVRPSRLPAPRTGPSVRFAGYQNLLDSRRTPSPSPATTGSSLSPMHVPPRRTYRGTARGLPQLKQLGAKSNAVRDDVPPRWQQQSNGVMAAMTNRAGSNGMAAHSPSPPWRSPLRSPQGPDAPAPVTVTPVPPAAHVPAPPAPVMVTAVPAATHVPASPNFIPPVAPPAASVPPAPAVARSYRQLVQEYGASRGLPVFFKTTKGLANKKGPVVYLATLKVGSQTFYSYPEEKVLPEDAEEEAARKAAHSFGLHQNSSPSAKSETRLPETDVSTPQKVDIFVSRIKELLAAKENGLWSTVVPDLYLERYRESVPTNWLELVKHLASGYNPESKDCRCILYAEPPTCQRAVQAALANLSFKGAGDSTQTKPQPLPQPQSEPNSASHAVPEALRLPKANHWDVFITYASSTADVYCRLVDYSEDYERLSNDMDEFYATRSLPVAHPKEDALYTTNFEGGWLRVQLLSVQEKQAECFFVDHGDVDIVPVEKLQELDPRFLTLPFQVVHCQLDELLDYAEDDQANRLLNELVVGKCLIAEVHSRELPVTVTLYDTTTAEDVNLNALMLKRLETPLLPGPDAIARVVLSHIDSDGNLYVQMQGARLQYVARYMEAVGSHIAQNQLKPASSLCKSKLYACRVDSGIFARVLLLETTLTRGMVLAKFVDNGRESLVAASHLYNLDSFGEKISSFPHQALVCRLADVAVGPWTDKATRLLREMVPADLGLLLKVVVPGKDGSPPLVSMFKRIEPNNELVSVNTSLAVALEVARQEDRKPKRALVATRRSSVPERKSEPATNGVVGGFPSPVSAPASPAPATGAFSLAGLPLPPAPPADHHHVEESVDTVGLALAELQAEGLEGVGRPLVAPPLPEPGSYLDVNVTEAAHPLNFTCQQWLQGAELEALMADMQSFYAAEGSSAFPEGLPEALLHTGGCYAGHHAQHNCWYRVLVQQVQGPQMISVYFVDYGDYSLMQPSELQPLWQRFRQLPAQAIRASLAGVAPINGDWNPVDCVNFRNRVKDRQFVARIVAKERDDRTGVEGAERLVVRLIDTSTAVDVHIDQELAQKGIVRLVPSSDH